MNTDNISKSLNTLFDNKTFSTSMSLLLALYAGAAAPALPNNVIVFFDTVIGKLLITFLIAYLSSKNIQLALMLAVAFVVSLNIINTNKINEGFRTIENYQDDGSSGDKDPHSGVEHPDPGEVVEDPDGGAAGPDSGEMVEDAEGGVEDPDGGVEDPDNVMAEEPNGGAEDPGTVQDGLDDDQFRDYEPFVPSTNMFSNTEQYYAPY